MSTLGGGLLSSIVLFIVYYFNRFDDAKVLHFSEFAKLFLLKTFKTFVKICFNVFALYHRSLGL